MPRRGWKRSPHAGGFTLVEILVALAMTGMLVALLMSSLYYGTRVQASLADELQVRERSLRRVDWFASSLQGCMPLLSFFRGNIINKLIQETSPKKTK